MSFYKAHKKEILTLHLISQIVGKIKLKYGARQPQWAHVILDITARGFSTGTLRCNTQFFEIEVNLVVDQIEIRTMNDVKVVGLEDGKTIQQYYQEILETTQTLGLDIQIQTRPQEMATKTVFEEDTEHHDYNKEVALEILKWFQIAFDLQMRFIAPIRKRKVYPGLFWGTFDVSSILVYDEHEPFADDTKIIERGAFDEHMVEFGFWLGDDNFEYPTFFILPYPFVSEEALEVTDDFPKGSYFSEKMAEYLLEIKTPIDEMRERDIIQFFDASFKKSAEYLKWVGQEYCEIPLKMEENYRNEDH